MLNGVWQSMGNQVDYGYKSIDVTSHSGNRYTIILSPSNYCKFNVKTVKDSPIGDIPVQLCLEIDEKGERPYGDILASWILALVNDEESSEDIDTLYDYLHGGYSGEVHCQFCNSGASFYLEDIPQRFHCEQCNVYSCELEPGEIEPGQTEMNLDRAYEEYNCPSCNNEVEVSWAGRPGYIAICHNDRMVITDNGDTWTAMRIDGELHYYDIRETRDADIVEYEDRLYRYTDGLDGELVEEEE